VPLLKIGTEEGTFIDVSLHNKSGVKAAAYMRKILDEYPASIPVILVLKSFLRQCNMDDVSLGGLGGYALANMVLAHCINLREIEEPEMDYGEVLMSFLETFGYKFDFVREAISSRHGGIVSKRYLGREAAARTHGPGLGYGKWTSLFVEDPLTGKNLAIGTNCFGSVQRLFRDAHKKLERCSIGDPLSEIMDVEQILTPRDKMTDWVSMLLVKKAETRAR